MRTMGSFLGGITLGAGLMYALDPERGARRRALMRDQAAHLLHRSQDFLGKAGRDLQHRVRGWAAEARYRVVPKEVADQVPPPGEPAEWQQKNWTPGVQLVAGVASGIAVIYGMRLLAQRAANQQLRARGLHPDGLRTAEYAGLASQRRLSWHHHRRES